MQIRRTLPSRLFSASILAAALFAAASPALRAQVISVWSGGTNNWNNTLSWGNLGVPNSVSSDARIDDGKTGIPSVATVDGAFALGRLVVDINDRIVFNNGQTLGINSGAFPTSGALINNGFVDVGEPDTQANLRFNGATSLIGTGVMTLHGDARVATNGTFTNYSNIQGDTSAYLGNGEGEGRLINVDSGVIDANTPGKKLYMSPNGNPGGLINSGIVRATNGGVLAIASATYTGTGAGSLTAFDGSEVHFGYNSAIAGGTLATVGTGVIRSTSNLNDNNLTLGTFTNAGTFIADVNTNTTFAAGATITNNGTMTFSATGAVSSVNLRGNVTLAGSGALILQEAARVAGDATGAFILTNQSTIQGESSNSGSLGNGYMGIANQGLILANVSGKFLLVNPSAAGLTNNGGTLRASGGGILRLSSGGGSFDNTGGTIEALDGSNVISDDGIVLPNNRNGTLTGGVYRATGPGAVVNLPGPVPTALAGGAQVI